ncbi:MAG TPA: hypothetical protein VNA28_04565, partial [Solirubrobacteraceae bacterium]|nr:hypothetical protein [Solirubrobacteraceae bacterium]
SAAFVDAYRQRKPDFVTYFSSFGRPEFHGDLNWAAWADGRFLGMPQANENLNTTKLKPHLCVRDSAPFSPAASCDVASTLPQRFGGVRKPAPAMLVAVACVHSVHHS